MLPIYAVAVVPCRMVIPTSCSRYTPLVRYCGKIKTWRARNQKKKKKRGRQRGYPATLNSLELLSGETLAQGAFIRIYRESI